MRRLILTVLIAGIVLSDAAKSNSKGIESFNEQNYEAALTDFRDAQLDDKKSPIIAHNIGSSLYQQKRYDKAIEEMSKSLTETTDSTVLSQLYYNIGNSMFRQDSLMQAITMYKKSLEYRPEDEDAKFNLELARALLKDNSEQQDQQQQQQQQNQDQQEQQQDQQNQDQQDQQDEQNQDEQDQQQDQQDQDQQDQDEQQQQQQQKKPEEMTEDEARNLLKALEDKEKDQQEERMKGMPGRAVGKDW